MAKQLTKTKAARKLTNHFIELLALGGVEMLARVQDGLRVFKIVDGSVDLGHQAHVVDRPNGELPTFVEASETRLPNTFNQVLHLLLLSRIFNGHREAIAVVEHNVEIANVLPDHTFVVDVNEDGILRMKFTHVCSPLDLDRYPMLELALVVHLNIMMESRSTSCRLLLDCGFTCGEAASGVDS